MRVNAFVGFSLGGLLSLAIMAAVPVLQPASIQVSHQDQVALPVASALGKAGLAVVFVSFFAAMAECALSSGHSVAQYMAGRGASGTRPARPPGSIWSAWPA
jgi:hypothetical protein